MTSLKCETNFQSDASLVTWIFPLLDACSYSWEPCRDITISNQSKKLVQGQKSEVPQSMPGQKIIFLDLAESNRRKQNSFDRRAIGGLLFHKIYKVYQDQEPEWPSCPQIRDEDIPKYVTFSLENLATPFQQTPNHTILFGKALFFIKHFFFCIYLLWREGGSGGAV